MDVVGDIAVVRLSEFTPREKKKIAEAILHGSKNVRVVMEQEGGIEGEFRLRRLRHLAGERRTTTLHRENGCAFRVDVAKTYFSPRLSTERLRVASLVRPRESVMNMFAGVGPYSVAIAKMARARVTSCEVNAYAARLHLENNRLNKVERLVTVINDDARNLPDVLKTKFDRILMPHPSQADKFLPVALEMGKRGTVIHYYRHVLGRNEKEAKVTFGSEVSALIPRGARFESMRVRVVGPRWIEMVADIRLGAQKGRL